jgi:DNA-binding MarR family transcriptional regulator
LHGRIGAEKHVAALARRLYIFRMATSKNKSGPDPVAMPLRKAAKPGHGGEEKPTVRAGVKTSALDRSLGYSLRRAQMSTFEEFSEAMESEGVRPSHYAVLVLIRENPGLSQSAVSRVLGIQKANLVTLLDALEQRGWTERRSVGGDRRASALHLTRTGGALVRKLEAAHHAMEERLTERLGAAKSAKLLKLLHQFCEAAGSTAD